MLKHYCNCCLFFFFCITLEFSTAKFIFFCNIHFKKFQKNHFTKWVKNLVLIRKRRGVGAEINRKGRSDGVSSSRLLLWYDSVFPQWHLWASHSTASANTPDPISSWHSHFQVDMMRQLMYTFKISNFQIQIVGLGRDWAETTGQH